MKKEYMSPSVFVVEVIQESALLSISSTGINVFDENALEEEYGFSRIHELNLDFE